MKPLVAAILALSLFVSPGCQTVPQDPNDPLNGPSEGQYGPVVLQILAPEGMTRLQIQHAIQNAVFTTNWETRTISQGDSTGLIQLYRKSFSYEAILTLVFDQTAIEGYIESYSLTYDGRRERRKVPESWINDLSRRITRNIELEAVGY